MGNRELDASGLPLQKHGDVWNGESGGWEPPRPGPQLVELR